MYLIKCLTALGTGPKWAVEMIKKMKTIKSVTIEKKYEG